jgi:hypothetical protein
MRRSVSAEVAASVGGRMARVGSATRAAWHFTAPIVFVDGRPRASLGFGLRHAALLVALGDVVGLAILLIGVFRFVSAGNRSFPQRFAVTEPERSKFDSAPGRRRGRV